MCIFLSERRDKGCWVKKKMHSIKKYPTFCKVFLIGPVESTNFWVKNTFLIQNCIIFYFLVINILTNIIDEIYLCPHTFLGLSPAFLNIPKKDTSNFSFNYKFDSVLCQINQMLLTSCFDCHKLLVKKHRSIVTCFIRYFP